MAQRGWCTQKEPSWELFAIRRTTCQMLQDRGYALPPEDSEDFTYESFLQRWNGKVHKDLTILGGCCCLHAGSRLLSATGAWAADLSNVPASKMDDDDKRIGVFFPVGPLEACVPPLHLPIAYACNTKPGQQNPPEAKTRKLSVDTGVWPLARGRRKRRRRRRRRKRRPSRSSIPIARLADNRARASGTRVHRALFLSSRDQGPWNEGSCG